MERARVSRRRPRGTATVEFVVVLPLLSLVMLMIMEFSRAWMTLNVVAAAAREGARVAVVTPLSGGTFDAGPAVAAKNAITTVLSGANLTASTTQRPTVTCADDPCAPGSQVTATVTVDFTTIFSNFFSHFGVMADSLALTNIAVMRYE